MKNKIDSIGDGESAVFTVGFYNDDFSVHYQSCAFPISELPEGATVDDVYELLKVGKYQRKAFDWLPV